MTILERFTRFHKENKHKLYMSNDTNHPINYKKGMAWVNGQCDTESRDFALLILNHTIYVSFKSFNDTMVDLCNIYLSSNKSEIDGVEIRYVLILPFGLNKSNSWVSLLMFEQLKVLITDIYRDITEVYNKQQDPESELFGKVVRCIICDDCAYTGFQLEYISSFDPLTIEYPFKEKETSVNNKRWLDWFTHSKIETFKVVENIDISKFSVDILVPYISYRALTRLSELKYVRIPSKLGSELVNAKFYFPIFSQLTDISKIPSHILNEFTRTFQYHSDISSIYFDHKIADAVSTFNKVYMLGPLFNCSSENKSIRFVSNCPDDSIPSDISIYSYYTDVADTSKELMCPIAFYKKIAYTYNGTTINKLDNILDFIDKPVV
jgi:hypothetical protein